MMETNAFESRVQHPAAHAGRCTGAHAVDAHAVSAFTVSLRARATAAAATHAEIAAFSSSSKILILSCFAFSLSLSAMSRDLVASDHVDDDCGDDGIESESDRK